MHRIILKAENTKLNSTTCFNQNLRKAMKKRKRIKNKLELIVVER